MRVTVRNQATSFAPAGTGIVSMHWRPRADTSEQVTVRTAPNGITYPSMWWFCTSGWFSAGSAVTFLARSSPAILLTVLSLIDLLASRGRAELSRRTSWDLPGSRQPIRSERATWPRTYGGTTASPAWRGRGGCVSRAEP